MGYLHPPPGDAPVIVMKDVGGDVRQYAAQTYAYIRGGREVRLHECRSACTLALAVPDVCVYPDGVLRFHKAYNPITKATNDGVSDAMMMAYPPAVRERLGLLTRKYKSLTGSELIRLGVRDCTAPAEPKIVIARASARPIGPEASVSNGMGGLFASFGAPDIPVYSGYGAPVRVAQVQVAQIEVQVAPVKVEVAEAAPVATSLHDATTAATTAAAQGVPEAETPAPPPRPPELSETHWNAVASLETAPPPEPPARPLALAAPPERGSAWGVHIRGSAPALASARFAPFLYRLTQKS